jgi:hypothetical protein
VPTGADDDSSTYTIGFASSNIDPLVKELLK